MSNIKSPRKGLANPSTPSPMKPKGPNWDWLGIAPEEPKSRLSTNTLLILHSPVTSRSSRPFDEAGVVPEEDVEITDLDQTLLKFGFSEGQFVWIKTDADSWTRGHIYGKQRTRQQMARTRTFETYWPVVCGTSKVSWFSPANGDIKPDTEQVRELLRREYGIDE